MAKMKNPRTMVVTTETGVDVKSTDQLSGQAKVTKAWNATNETTQYTTGKTQMGQLGGLPSGD